jgi:hypothetical protein
MIGIGKNWDSGNSVVAEQLGRYLCEVRAGQYWRLEDLK